MEKVLFITNPPRRCGVHEFGKSTCSALQCSTHYAYVYREFSEQTTSNEFLKYVESAQASAIIFNWHPSTMPWLSDDVLYALHRQQPTIRTAAIVHDLPAPFDWIDGNIFNDPTRGVRDREFVVGRRLWNRPIPTNDPGATIGSFGFGLEGKGFQKVIAQVNAEFDQATVRLHIPHSDYCDADGSRSRALVQECMGLAKPGIQIEISSEYLSTDAMLNWLAGNAVNCFFYDELKGRGISSVIDFALSARRPIAITPSVMFRHIVSAVPSIVIGQQSLKEIIRQGTAPLEPYYEAWNEQNLAISYDRVVDGIRSQPVIDLRGNRVLTPRDRQRLRPVVDDLATLCPDIMSRKIPDAVFQNAFIFEQARQLAKSNDRIILIGGYEDPIGPALMRLGHDVVITDPQIDGRTSDDVLLDSIRHGKEYDLVISCSVIEHVEEDFEFVKALYALLAPGGTALLTTDFRDGWEPGIVKPTPDVRLYTPQRLRLLVNSLPNHAIPDGHDWQPIPAYFHYDFSDYGFCSIMFQKPKEELHRRDASYPVQFMVQQMDRMVARQLLFERTVQGRVHEEHRLATENQRLVDENQRIVSENEKFCAESLQMRERLSRSKGFRLHRLERLAKKLRASVGL